MLTIESRKKIVKRGEIIEISPKFAESMFFTINVRLKDFKPDARFFMIMYDHRKSNTMFYHFEMLQIKEYMMQDLPKRTFKSASFTRDNLIFWNFREVLIKKLDTVETAMLYLYSPITLRREYV
jgi:hypothetical protein